MQETVYLRTDDATYQLLANEGVTLVGFEGGAMLFSSGYHVRVRGTVDGTIIRADHIAVVPSAPGASAPVGQGMMK